MAENKGDITSGYLEGHLLIAMPSMRDSRFARAVIYICAHSADGAMGLVTNKLLGATTFPDLLEQLGLPETEPRRDIRVHFGGPVEVGRGFVLHDTSYRRDGTMVMDNGIALTATIDILQEIAAGGGPQSNILALGYAGWGPGQLESEIQDNAWLHVTPDAQLLFNEDIDSMWDRAVAKIGIDVNMLSETAGRA